MKKKMLSLALVLVMCLSLVPGAFAAETAAAEKPAEVAATEDIFARFILDDPELVSSFKYDDTAAWGSNIRYMLKHGLSELELTIDFTGASDALYVPSDVVSKYNYLCYSFKLSDPVIGGPSTQRRTLTICRTEDEWSVVGLTKVIEVHDALWASGKITDTMTQKEKARVYYDWVISHCEYSYDLPEYLGGYASLAYPVLVSGKGICGNYAMTYNLFLKLEGVDCADVWSTLGNHVWTSATLDGVLYHIDPTWGDTTGQPNKYFCMTEEAAWARFGGYEKEKEFLQSIEDIWKEYGFDPSDFDFDW